MASVLGSPLQSAQPKLHFRNRGGTLVPYTRIFEKENSEHGIKLPIKRVVVGPHPDKFQRKVSIERWLESINAEADVVVSEIPYVG
jgi:hypothetical protein